MKRKYKNVTEMEFKQLKYLISELQMTAAQVSQTTGRSSFTLQNIAAAADFADYKKIVREIVARQAISQNKITEPGQYKKTEVVSQSELLIILGKINDNLARLVEAWNVRPDKEEA